MSSKIYDICLNVVSYMCCISLYVYVNFMCSMCVYTRGTAPAADRHESTLNKSKIVEGVFKLVNPNRKIDVEKSKLVDIYAM